MWSMRNVITRSCLAVIAFCTTGAISDFSKLTAEDKIACRVDGRAITVQDLTTVDYAEVVAICKSCRLPFNISDGYFEPAIGEASVSDKQDAVTFHTECMNGVLLRLVASLVLDDLSGADRPKIDQVRRSKSRQLFLQERVRQSAERNRIDLIMLEGGPIDQVLTEYRTAFPKLASAFTEAAIVDMRSDGAGERYIAAKCFPRIKGDRVAPWMDYDFDRYLLGWVLERYLEKHRHELWEEYEGARSQRIGLIFRGSCVNDSPAIDALARDLVSKDGAVARSGLVAVNRILHDLGSSTKLSEVTGSPQALRMTWDSLPDVPISRKSYVVAKHRARYDWMWTQTLREPEATISTVQGSPVMEIGRIAFLRDAFERVLKRIQFEPPYKAPDKRFYIEAAIPGGLPEMEMGFAMPDGFSDLRDLLPKDNK